MKVEEIKLILTLFFYKNVLFILKYDLIVIINNIININKNNYTTHFFNMKIYIFSFEKNFKDRNLKDILKIQIQENKFAKL